LRHFININVDLLSSSELFLWLFIHPVHRKKPNKNPLDDADSDDDIIPLKRKKRVKNELKELFANHDNHFENCTFNIN
jgi:hypothetical protein